MAPVYLVVLVLQCERYLFGRHIVKGDTDHLVLYLIEHLFDLLIVPETPTTKRGQGSIPSLSILAIRYELVYLEQSPYLLRPPLLPFYLNGLC